MKLREFIKDWVWQLPQNLCGLLWKNMLEENRITEVSNSDSDSVGARVFLQRTKGGVTLGKYMFICQDYTNKYKVIKHECGHVKQSKILGPLYLIVVGIPSIVHAWLHKYVCSDKNYYHFYTESWADRLMDLKR